MRLKEVFNLHGIDILSSGNNDVLFAVHQPDEAVLIHAGNIAGGKPPVKQGFSGGARIAIVLLHNPGTFDHQFSGGAPGRQPVVLIHDFAFPVEAGFSDGAHLVEVFHPEMDAARPGAFRKSVIRVVRMTGEELFPLFHQARRHGLGAHVHESPWFEAVVV